MKNRSSLKTIRLSKNEQKRISRFIQSHPYLRNFSTLVRAALWEFLEKHAKKEAPSAPSFLWEYDLTKGEIQEMLNGPQKDRLWLEAKILEHGRWEEIWDYLTVQKIAHDLPRLRLPPKTKEHWNYALHRWGTV